MFAAPIGSEHYKERDVIAKGGANCSRNCLIILLYEAETKIVYFFKMVAEDKRMTNTTVLGHYTNMSPADLMFELAIG